MMSGIAQKLHKVLGDKGWLTGQDTNAYSRDWLDCYGMTPLGVARPADTEEVSAVVRLCGEANVVIVPQGGNTGLCGASVCGEAGGVILSLSRMTNVGLVDSDSGCIEVEAGVVLANLHAVLAEHSQMFPLHLGAEGSANIGGLIATNAGGSHAFRYGTMQDLVLGLEVVLPDGRIWNGMRAVQKDNAGYQLRRLFCGSEGTLGVVTRAVLRLFPAPQQRVTALLALPEPTALVSFATRLRASAGEFLNGLEFFNDTGVGLVLKHLPNVAFPLESHSPWYLLVELTTCSVDVPLDSILDALLVAGMESGEVTDGALAMSEGQRLAFWQLREEQPEGQRLEGRQLKHDLSVPPGSLGKFLAEADVICSDTIPGVLINPFGHMGDGNVHFNLTLPQQLSLSDDMLLVLTHRLGELISRLRGSFAAEHGLGRSKVALADTLRDPIERQLMKRIKLALDAKNIMNPGVGTNELT